MILNVCMKFQENIFNGFHFFISCQAQTIFCHGTASYKFKEEYLKKYIFKNYGCCALHIVYDAYGNTCMKFYEHILNGF